jgi:hypothetical protein
MHDCWKSAKSSGLLIGSSQALTTDQVKFNLVSLPRGTEQTSVRYSIEVTQHALNKEEYDYLTLMKKIVRRLAQSLAQCPRSCTVILKTWLSQTRWLLGM